MIKSNGKRAEFMILNDIKVIHLRLQFKHIMIDQYMKFHYGYMTFYYDLVNIYDLNVELN